MTDKMTLDDVIAGLNEDIERIEMVNSDKYNLRPIQAMACSFDAMLRKTVNYLTTHRAEIEEMAGLRTDYELVKEERANLLTLIRDLADALEKATIRVDVESVTALLGGEEAFTEYFEANKALITRAREACHEN